MWFLVVNIVCMAGMKPIFIIKNKFFDGGRNEDSFFVVTQVT